MSVAKQRNQKAGRQAWFQRGGSAATVGYRKGFRSGLEEKNDKHLRDLGVNDTRFEQIKIKYEIPATGHTYTPDFTLPNGIIIETKGKFEPNDRSKHLFVQAQHSELDIRFVFSRPSEPIYKGSKTTLAQWAEAHNFKWANKLVPPEWLLEPGPDVKPDEVLRVGKRNEQDRH